MADLADSGVIDVLLVEDHDGDVLMTREAFEYFEHFIEAIRQIDDFFLTLVCLPG